jgi:hypothetical protein
VGVGVAVLEGVGLGEAVGVAAGDGVATGVADGDGVGETEGFKGTPRFQTNFFPDFTHVYLKFPKILVEFIFTHLVPAIEAD